MPTTPPERPPLAADAVAGRLADLDGGRWRADVLAATPSTNAVAAERWRAGEAAGLVVVTDHQVAGRGRLDRAWVTPAGAALTLSLLVAPDAVPTPRWPWLPLLTGVAVVEAVRRVAGVEVALKWPNDVLVGDRKLAGILVERVEGPRGAGAIVGVGLNVSQTPSELPVPTATSLAMEAEPPDRTDLLVAVLECFGALVRRVDRRQRRRGPWAARCLRRPLRDHRAAGPRRAAGRGEPARQRRRRRP